MSETERLQKLIKAVGLDGILKYRAQPPPPLLKPVASGSQFFAQQQSSETSPLQPHPLDSDIEVVSTVTPKIKAEQPPHDKAQTQSCTNSKKRQVASENEVIELSDDDHSKKKKLKKARHGKFPESWTSCREDESFGFLLDMRRDTREWPFGSDGKKLSMVAKIKQEDTDSWGKGSGGSIELKDCPIVFALDEQRCQVARHSCSGSYIYLVGTQSSPHTTNPRTTSPPNHFPDYPAPNSPRIREDSKGLTKGQSKRPNQNDINLLRRSVMNCSQRVDKGVRATEFILNIPWGISAALVELRSVLYGYSGSLKNVQKLYSWSKRDAMDCVW
ncbi:hypothetical protein C8J56DRAFT_898811 [Mycena floridula]|nr:hypothetical protein C8J56DRAFT_898811 [Mycena floridula]